MHADLNMGLERAVRFYFKDQFFAKLSFEVALQVSRISLGMGF
jgi:hypothetical protein